MRCFTPDGLLTTLSRSQARPSVPRTSLPNSGFFTGLQSRAPRDLFWEETQMKNQLGMLFGLSALMVGPAMAQNAGPNPAQAAAKTLLQAADKAIGASTVKSYTVTATGRMG